MQDAYNREPEEVSLDLIIKQGVFEEVQLN